MIKIAVELKKVEQLKEFDSQNFKLNPRYWGYHSEDAHSCKAIVDLAEELAKEVDGICIAIVKDEISEFILATSNGYSSEFVLFNAELCKEKDGELHAFSSIKDFWMKFEKGGMII